MAAFEPTGPSIQTAAAPAGTRYVLPATPAEGLLLSNMGGTDAWFALGDVTVTCTVTTGVPLMSRSQQAFTVSPLSSTHIFVIGVTNADIFVTPGGGE